jgi:hypothetical protein
MPDTRPRATATVDVDLAALAEQIGDDRLALAEDGRTVVYVGDGEVTQAKLAAAVKAHTPPEPEPPLPTYAELVAEVRGIRERAAQAASTVTGNAATVGNAIAGPRT